MRSLCALMAFVGLVVAGCGGRSAAAPPSVVVTPSGTIGPLRIDVSGRANVIAFAGRPALERRSRYMTFPPYDALGYGCKGQRFAEACRTVFYLDTRSGKLVILTTEERRFVAMHGIHVGTPTATVERLMHRRVRGGCDAYLFFRTRSAYLVLQFSGGSWQGKDLHVVGGRVGSLVLHSQRRNPGVLDCIDTG
jgi:hypothetical protein